MFAAFSSDAAEADNKLHLQARNSPVDADADVDETVPCIDLSSNTQTLVGCLVCFGFTYHLV